ncbi:MAG: gliding motility-associated C-terminal domain-containing protein [Bacteroidota bacterium]
MKQTFWLSILLCIAHNCGISQNNPILRSACTSTCTGNLGENIFPDGDFGSGVANVLPSNPGYAPGYSYQLNPPPDDGYFTITNNTSSWGWFANTWIDIQDHGPEPNGYMMVVNASYQPGLFYQKTVSVCENTLYEFSIDVINLLENQGGIAPNIAFLINSAVVCETGNVPADKTWHTFRFSFTTAPGQGIVALALRNNAPGGLGNDLAIDNISFRACGPEIQLPDLAYYCNGSALTLHAALQNSPYSNTVYQWQYIPKGGSVWTNLPNANGVDVSIAAPNDSSLYRLVVANSIGNLALPYCRAVSDYTEPVLEDLSGFAISGTDTIICNGAPAMLEAGTYAAYKWSNGAASSSIEAALPGSYAVTITTPHGCTASDDITVRAVKLTAEADWQAPVCTGDSSGTVMAKNIQGGSHPIQFVLDVGAAQSAPGFSHIPAGAHVLTVSDSLNCRFKISKTLEDPSPFQLSLGADKSIVIGDSLTLTSSANYTPVSFHWEPEIGLNCSDCPSPVASPSKSTTYTLFVADALGCSARSSILIQVLPRLDVYAPNVFLQDFSDGGPNHYFTIYPSQSATLIRRLTIYDRWGDIVFNRNDLVPGDRALQWEGTSYSGKPSESGVYVWLAEIEFTDGLVRAYSGDVTLLRN